VFAVRDGLWILGTLGAAAAPGLVRAWQGLPATGAERQVFAALAPACALIVLGTFAWCGIAVREPDAPPRVAATPASATRDAWANRPFRILLIAYGIGALGAAMPGTLILYYVEHVLRAPHLAELFLGIYFLSGFLCLPAWTALARRTGKKTAWLTAMAVSVGAFAGAALLGPGDIVAYGLICAVSGLGFGAGLVLPASMVADVVDLDELKAGTRREGLYYGLWSIVTKLSAALGAGLALPALKWAGYVTGPVQDDDVLLVLRLLYAAVPCACYVGAWFVARRFPLDAAAHDAIRARLAPARTATTVP
jgi:GPH family glycoside/pentoside/hexuronide:cation symporter